MIATGSTLDCANSSDPVFYVGQVGSNGNPGYGPQYADSYGREATSLYADLSHQVTDNLFLQGAVRGEDYDDFGTEVTWKLAGILDVTENFAIRGSLGTSFALRPQVSKARRILVCGCRMEFLSFVVCLQLHPL